MTRPVSVVFYSAFGILLLSVLSPLLVTLLKPAVDLPNYYPAPEFALVDSSARKFESGDLRGKIWVANFFFTSCQGPCPLLSANIAKLHDKFAKQPGINFVSISVDSETDTPEKLAEYKARIAPQSERWHFLAGEKAEVAALLNEGFKLGTVEDPKFHSTRFVLVDRSGEIRGFYQGTDAESVKLLEQDVEALLH